MVVSPWPLTSTVCTCGGRDQMPTASSLSGFQDRMLGGQGTLAQAPETLGRWWGTKKAPQKPGLPFFQDRSSCRVPVRSKILLQILRLGVGLGGFAEGVRF